MEKYQSSSSHVLEYALLSTALRLHTVSLIRRFIQFVLVVFPVVTHASVSLTYFDTVLGIQRDGSVVVVEKFEPAKPASTLTWSTSTENRGRWGIHDPRVVNILQVTSVDGRPVPFKLKRGVSRLEVEIDTRQAKEIRLVYAVRNAVSFLNDRDELVWSPGEGWRGEIQRASIFIQVPPESASQFRAQVFQGGVGLLPVKATDAGPDRVWFEASAGGSGRELLVHVVFPPGILKQPGFGKRFWWFLGANTIVLLPLATLAVMVVLRKSKRLPAPEEMSLTPRYEPPQGMTPAEVGVLLDDSLDPCDVAATLVDLATRRYIQLEYCKPDAGVEFEGQDFVIRLLRAKDELYLLPLHERTLLFHAFYGGVWTKYSSLRLRFYDIVPLMQRQVLQLLRRKGMYWTDPDYAPSARLTMLVIFLAIAAVIQVLGLFSFASSWLLSGISVAISAAIVYYFGRTITAKTLRGVRTYQQVLGFQQFLDAVERDRMQRLEASLYEKWLPFAMALRVEHHWANAFSGMAIRPPEWMSGVEDMVFNTDGLAHVLDGFARQTGTSIFVMPRGYRWG